MGPNQPQPHIQGQFQPYPQQYPRAYPPPVTPYSRAWHITKIVLLSFSLIFCIVVLGISIAIIVDPDIQNFEIVWVAPQAGIALCWSIAELITICARSAHRGIHPGAHVALHLILWLGFCVSAGLTAYELSFALECDYYCRNYNYYYNYYSDRFISSQEALLAFLGLLIITHFTLFVRACVETAQRNSMSAATQVLIMPQPMFYPPPMAQYPVPQAVPSAQPGFPVEPNKAHLSGYYGPTHEVQHHITGSTHTSQPSAPAPVQESGAAVQY